MFLHATKREAKDLVEAGLWHPDVGGWQINGWDELVVAVRNVRIGEPVDVVIVRQGQEMTMRVTPTERP